MLPSEDLRAPQPALSSFSLACTIVFVFTDIIKLFYNLRAHMKRIYYSERSGRAPSSISPDHLKKILDIQYRKFRDKDYFKKAFGYECTDLGDVQGDTGTDLDGKLLLDFGGRGESMIPTLENIMKLDMDSLFDLIEFLHEYVAKPIDPVYHEWYNCGIHVHDASYKEGREEWRSKLNESLSLLEPSYRLNTDGNIELLSSSVGLEHIVDQHTSHGDSENIDEMVNRSCKLFLKRSATLDDKRDAIRNLADVLELLRKDVNEKLPDKEVNDIFNIANNFGIRHHNDRQQTQYNRGVYYYWIFYTYLATIDLLGRLRENSSMTK